MAPPYEAETSSASAEKPSGLARRSWGSRRQGPQRIPTWRTSPAGERRRERDKARGMGAGGGEGSQRGGGGIGYGDAPVPIRGMIRPSRGRRAFGHAAAGPVHPSGDDAGGVAVT
ncbi:hypothetical protein ABZP36_020894 [Zizania latifolia]